MRAQVLLVFSLLGVCSAASVYSHATVQNVNPHSFLLSHPSPVIYRYSTFQQQSPNRPAFPTIYAGEVSPAIFTRTSYQSPALTSIDGLAARDLLSTCRSVFLALVSFLPSFVVQTLTVLVLLPPALAVDFLTLLIPGVSPDWIGLVFRCITSGAEPLYGADPHFATANFREVNDTVSGAINESINGSLYIAQTLSTQEEPGVLRAVGRLQGLTPGQAYRLQLHGTGGCEDIGEYFGELGAAPFVASATGEVALALEQPDTPLDAILGRVVALVSPDGAARACGVLRRGAAYRRARRAE